MHAVIAVTTLQLPSRKFITGILSVIALALLVLYMYFLTMSVVHVVMRKEVTQDIQSLVAEVATLEHDFMLAQHVVSTAIVDNQQYSQTNEKIFVSRNKPMTVAISGE